MSEKPTVPPVNPWIEKLKSPARTLNFALDQGLDVSAALRDRRLD